MHELRTNDAPLAMNALARAVSATPSKARNKNAPRRQSIQPAPQLDDGEPERPPFALPRLKNAGDGSPDLDKAANGHGQNGAVIENASRP